MFREGGARLVSWEERDSMSDPPPRGESPPSSIDQIGGGATSSPPAVALSRTAATFSVTLLIRRTYDFLEFLVFSLFAVQKLTLSP